MHTSAVVRLYTPPPTFSRVFFSTLFSGAPRRRPRAHAPPGKIKGRGKNTKSPVCRTCKTEIKDSRNKSFARPRRRRICMRLVRARRLQISSLSLSRRFHTHSASEAAKEKNQFYEVENRKYLPGVYKNVVWKEKTRKEKIPRAGLSVWL